MDYLLYIIAIFYTAICVYFFVYMRLVDEVSKFDKIKTIIFSIVSILIFIFLPIIVSNIVINPYMVMFFLAVILMATNIVIHIEQKSLFVEDKPEISRILLIIKVFYILFYVPVIILFLFRFKSIEIGIFSTIGFTLLILGIFLFFRYLLTTKHTRMYLKIQNTLMVSIWLIYFLLIGFNVFRFYSLTGDASEDNLYVKFAEVDTDYRSINQYGIDDEIIDGKLIDFHFDEEYLYYVVANKYEAYLRIYSNDSKEVVESYKMEVPFDYFTYALYDKLLDKKNVITIIEDDIYLFGIDGIYILDGLNKTKISDFSAIDTIHFILGEEGINFVYSPKEDFYEIYLIADGSVVLIDELDYTETSGRYHLFSNSDKLLIKDVYLESYQIYGSNLVFIPDYSNRELRVELVTNNHIIFDETRSENIKDYRGFYISYSDGTGEFISYIKESVYNLSNYNNLYIQSAYRTYNSSTNLYFYDEYLNRVNSFNPIYMETNIFGVYNAQITGLNVYQDRIYYGAQSDRRGPLSFEINELIISEPNYDLQYFKYISSISIFVIAFLLYIPSNKYIIKPNDGGIYYAS